MDYGIDLSHYNAVSDAAAVRADGITFAWCKATEGAGTIDPTFAAKVNQLRGAGIVVGAYHFARAGDPAAQARFFASVAAGAGCLTVGALIPMLDMESPDVRSNANTFVTAFADALDCSMDTYGSLDWWLNVLRPSEWGSRSIVGHIARYNGDPGNPGWTYPRMACHQHTDAGTVPGIPGNVDRDCTMVGYDLAAITIGHAPNTAPVAGPPPTPPAASGDTWTVAAGDTLSRIASAWGVTVSALAAANGIPNPDLIMVGQVIHRPGSASAAPSPTGGSSYTVKPGDTLSAIAAAHGTSVAVLVTLNHISNPDRINAGQVLTLPTAGAATPAPAPQHTYTVKAGDTLGTIAARLGYPGGWSALAARNNLANPNHIYPGQVLYY